MKPVLLALLLCAGCSTAFKRLPQTQAKNLEAAREETAATALALGQARRHLQAALILSPSNAPLAGADTAAALADRLASRAQALIGPPAIPQADRVQSLLNPSPAALARERARESDQAEQLAAQRTLEVGLIEKGKTYELQHNRGILRRSWAAAVGSLGIGGLIALVICFPAALPILGSALGLLISKIPQISSLIGLVGKRSYERAVTAIQEIKDQSKAAGKHDLAGFARAVAAQNTANDAPLVAHIKQKLNY
jgi:hypothetical protein